MHEKVENFSVVERGNGTCCCRHDSRWQNRAAEKQLERSEGAVKVMRICCYQAE